MPEEKLIPELRFPEFEGRWVEKKLEEVADFHDNRRNPLSETERSKRRGKYPYYGASGIIDYVDDYIFDGEFVLLGEDGANIITRSSRLAFLISGKCWINNHAHVLKARASNQFLAESLERIRYEKYNTGTAQPKLNSEVCKKILLHFPQPEEQQKIAAFLTAVDQRIQQLRQKKAKLEEYKKGVMQQLFSQTLRFKDENGDDFLDWEEKKLGEVCKVNPNSVKLPQEFIYIDLESVDKGMLIKQEKISKGIAPSRAQRVLKKNDVLYQTVRPYQRNNLFFSFKGDYVASTGYAQLRAKESPSFLFYLLHTDSFVGKVMNRCTGTSYPAINSSDLSNIEVSIPSLLEQQKIASFLSSIDNAIEKVSQQIDDSVVFKKGLLQKMFV